MSAIVCVVCGADLGAGAIPKDSAALITADPTDGESRKDYRLCHQHAQEIINKFILTANPAA